jgi:hypothetical protein
LEHEIRGKALPVPFNCLVQNAGLDLVKCGEIGIEKHFVTANYKDEAFDERLRVEGYN